MQELFTTTNKTLSDQWGICNLNYTNPWSRGLGFGGPRCHQTGVKGTRRMCPSRVHAFPSRTCPRWKNKRILSPVGPKPTSMPNTGCFSRFIPEDIPTSWNIQGVALFWKCGWVCRQEYPPSHRGLRDRIKPGMGREGRGRPGVHSPQMPCLPPPSSGMEPKE